MTAELPMFEVQLLEEAQARQLIEIEKDEKSGGYVVKTVAG